MFSLQNTWIQLITLNQLLCIFLEGAAQPTYLVIGGASFVGYHVTLRLSERGEVVVLDEFKKKPNSWQKLRAQELSTKKSISIHQGDFCNPHLITEVFRQHQIQAVVYSLPDCQQEDNVMRQVELNTECIANFLEVMKKHQNTYAIFLSSSIVYSGSPPPHTPVSHITYPPPIIPVALKVSAEEMVSTYCELYDLKVLRLRLFNTYGPWSGPSNIVYDMAEQLFGEGRVDIPTKNSVDIKRDFVFIDDVVEAILLLLDHTPSGCDEVYNIGSGQAMSVDLVLELMEKLFNKKAVVSSISIVEPEIHEAEISMSKRVWNYSPTVSVQEGISKFAAWFKRYYKQLKSGYEPDASLENRVLNDYVKYRSEQYIERVRSLRERYEKYAEEHGYPISKLTRTKSFIKHSGFVFNGGNNQKIHDLKELEYRCQLFDECIGYDTAGKLTGVLDPQSSWQKGSGAVYVADVDVCKAGVHKCYRNASCVYKGSGQFKCACPSGWKLYQNHDCIELYRKGRKSQAEVIEEITDKIDGLDWKTFAKSDEFYSFKGKTVKNEYLVYYPEAKDNIPLLKEACRKSYHCMGFTSDGVLMSNVDVRKWVNDPNLTLYARDVDYCSIDEVKCRPGQRCKRESPGKYSCS